MFVSTKLLTGKSGYDIVVHAASSASRLVPTGILHKIDVKKLPNWAKLIIVVIGLAIGYKFGYAVMNWLLDLLNF